jgi:MFS family permease
VIPILLFIAAFAMSLGPVPWILCSEIFPTKLRGRAMSLATFTVWTCCAILTLTFPVLKDMPAVGASKIFFGFAIVSLLGLIFVATSVPETKGRSLEEIEKAWN